MSNKFYNAHYNRTFYNESNFLVMMICGIVFTAIS